MLMAADVSSLMRMMSRHKEKEGGETRRDLVTMDLLGGSQELDLDLKVPIGYEKRLDLVSGEMSFQRSNSNTSAKTTSRTNPDRRGLQDLNFTPILTSSIPSPPPPPNLDLMLFSPSFSSPTSEYQSVCTLDKVKFALDRIKNTGSCLSPTSSSTTSSSLRQKQMRQRGETEENSISKSNVEVDGNKRIVAAGCPGCLSYVLISKWNPRCPRCDTAMPFPAVKKPRIDLNSTN